MPYGVPASPERSLWHTSDLAVGLGERVVGPRTFHVGDLK